MKYFFDRALSLFLVTVVSSGAFGVDFEWEYRIDTPAYGGNGSSIAITGCVSCPDQLIIPDEIDGLPVTKIGFPGFRNQGLTEVQFGVNIITLDNFVFAENQLTVVSLPDRTKTIGNYTFWRNKLFEVIIPNNVTTIGNNAFAENSLASIQLGSDLETIGTFAFHRNAISSLIIPGAIAMVRSFAFGDNPLVAVSFLGDRPQFFDYSFGGSAYSPAYTYCTGKTGWPGASIFNGITPINDCDNDGILDINDADDDGDGVADSSDTFPLDSAESIDTDKDGTGNNADNDDDGDGVADEFDAFPLSSSESLDIDTDGIGDNIDLDTNGDGYFDDRYFSPLDLQNLFLLSERSTTRTDDYLTIEKGGSQNEILYRLPVSNAGNLSLSDSFSVEIEMIEQRNYGSSDKDLLTGISDGENVILFTNNDTNNGGAWIGQDLGGSITESNRVSFWGNFEHYLILFEWSEGQAQLTVEVIAGDDNGYIESHLIGSAGQLDISKDLDFVLVGNGTNENYRLEGINILYPDRDFDGAPNSDDAFPLDALERTDSDSDGLGNNADTDDDGDGVLDTNDAYPLISLNGLMDTDLDGLPNECNADCLDASMTADADDDGDGVADSSDAFPLDLNEITDTDSDGVGNNADTDDDGDGVLDTNDAYPLISLNGLMDIDLDGLPNECDSDCLESGMIADADDDGDGVNDTVDAFPLDSSEQIDTDGDGIGDNTDPYPEFSDHALDSDIDGMPDAWESRYGLDPNDASDASSDQDNDGVSAYDEFIAGTIPAGSIDIDGNGQYDALTDGLLLLRGMFGLSEGALISGAVASDAANTSSSEIVSRIDMLGDLIDIDGNGRVDALTDGLIILRYLFGLRGDVLINGVIASDATVTSADGVGAKMESLMPVL